MWLVIGTKIVLAACTACATALYFAPILIVLAYKLKFLDIPNTALKNHRQATPYLGGLVVYLGMLRLRLFFFSPCTI